MSPERPILELERSPVERVADALTLAGLAACVAAVAAAFVWVDGPVPTHMNAAGEPDAWGGPGVLVFVAMVAMAIATMLTAFRGAPHTFNYPVVVTAENAPRLYRLSRELLAIAGTIVAWTFAAIEASFLAVALRLVDRAPALLPVTLTITFVPLVVYFVRMRRAA